MVKTRAKIRNDKAYYRSWYLPLMGTTANVVRSDLHLNFQDQI